MTERAQLQMIHQMMEIIYLRRKLNQLYLILIESKPKKELEDVKEQELTIKTQHALLPSKSITISS